MINIIFGIFKNPLANSTEMARNIKKTSFLSAAKILLMLPAINYKHQNWCTEVRLGNVSVHNRPWNSWSKILGGLNRLLLTENRGGTPWTGDFKCREVKTGFCRKRWTQTGSSGTLIGWKSGQTTLSLCGAKCRESGYLLRSRQWLISEESLQTRSSLILKATGFFELFFFYCTIHMNCTYVACWKVL